MVLFAFCHLFRNQSELLGQRGNIERTADCVSESYRQRFLSPDLGTAQARKNLAKRVEIHFASDGDPPNML